ncbi:UNVERIFIED_CONTAM: hypothetical protein HDU68_000133 [Siphonaria sp. JEL0065]|nr:hypothetical protein HDU68_000133 [Siphonaria sp. JEL0065]
MTPTLSRRSATNNLNDLKTSPNIDGFLLKTEDDVLGILSTYCSPPRQMQMSSVQQQVYLRRTGSLPVNVAPSSSDTAASTTTTLNYIATHNRLSNSSLHSEPISLSDIEHSNAQIAASRAASLPSNTTSSRVLISNSNFSLDPESIGIDEFIDRNQSLHHRIPSVTEPFIVARRRFLGGLSPNEEDVMYSAASLVLHSDGGNDLDASLDGEEALSYLSTAAEPTMMSSTSNTIHHPPSEKDDSPTTKIKKLEEILAETKVATRTVIKGLLADIQSDKLNSESALRILGASLDESRQETRFLQQELDKLLNERQEMLALIEKISNLVGIPSTNGKNDSESMAALIYGLNRKLELARVTRTPHNEAELEMCQISECSSSISERDASHNEHDNHHQFPISPTTSSTCTNQQHTRISIMTRNSLQTLQDSCNSLISTLQDCIHPQFDQILVENKRCAFENIRMAELVIKAVESSNKEEQDAEAAAASASMASSTTVQKKSSELFSYIGTTSVTAPVSTSTVVGSNSVTVLNQIRKGSSDLGQMLFRSAAAPGNESSSGGVSIGGVGAGSSSELRPTIMQRLKSVVAVGNKETVNTGGGATGQGLLKRSDTVSSKLLDDVMKNSENMVKDLEPSSSDDEEVEERENINRSLQSTSSNLQDKSDGEETTPKRKDLQEDDYTCSTTEPETCSSGGEDEYEDGKRTSLSNYYGSMDECDSLDGRRGRVIRIEEVSTPKAAGRSKSDTENSIHGKPEFGVILPPVIGNNQSIFFGGPLDPLALVPGKKRSVSPNAGASLMQRAQNQGNSSAQRSSIVLEKFEKSRTGEWWDNLKKESQTRCGNGGGGSREKSQNGWSLQQQHRRGSESTIGEDPEDRLRDRVIQDTADALDQFTAAKNVGSSLIPTTSLTLGRSKSQRKDVSGGNGFFLWRSLSKNGNSSVKMTHRVSDPIPNNGMRESFSIGLNVSRDSVDSTTSDFRVSEPPPPPVPEVPKQFKKEKQWQPPVNSGAGSGSLIVEVPDVGLVSTRNMFVGKSRGITSPPVSSASYATGVSVWNESNAGGEASVGLGGLMRKVSVAKKTSGWKLGKK